MSCTPRKQLVYSTIEPDAYCVTADYALQADGTISVHNYQTTGSPTEGVSTIDGMHRSFPLLQFD